MVNFKPRFPGSADQVLTPTGKPLLETAEYLKGIELPTFRDTPTSVTKNDKRITRWQTIIRDTKGEVAGYIYLSIFDAETNPVLIENYYNVNNFDRGISTIKKFEVVPGKPGHFRIEYDVLSLYYEKGGKAKPNDKLRIPLALTFNLQDHQVGLEMISDLGTEDKDRVITQHVSNRVQVAPDDFKKAAKAEDWHYGAFKPGRMKSISYDNYFAQIGVSFPKLKSDSYPVVSQQAVEDKRITRWTAKIIDPKTGQSDGEVHVAVFDAATNPVLIEAFYNYGGIYRLFNGIEKFEILPKAPGQFRIQFEVPDFYYLFGSKKGKLGTDRNIPNVPKALTFGGKKANMALELISDLNSPNVMQLKAKKQKLAPSGFKKSHPSDAYKVLEPSTIHPLSYNEYFGAKGIYFPHHSRAGGSRRESYSYSYSSIKSADDLKLGDLLKDKKAEVWQLLQSTEKPTVTEFLKVIGIKPNESDKNPFENYLRNWDLKKQLKRDLPEVIAQFEKAFPSAIWYALGRDIYLFGDAMDAYYLFIGQPNRVKRLPASQPSFNEEDPQEVIDFLKTNGFDFAGINKDSTPHIIFDVTSYSKKEKSDYKHDRFSQSAQLMRAAYLEWDRLGRNPFDLLSKVNFVSVSKGTNNYMIMPESTIYTFFNQMEFDPPAPKRILQVDGPMSLQYATTWHSIYERFERTKDDKIIAPFHGKSDNRDKLAMLAELWDVAAIVMSDDFAKDTTEQIKRYKEGTVKQPKANRKRVVKPCDGILSDDFKDIF